MQEQIEQENSYSTVRITRAAMEEELGNAYKRCWACAFKYASDELAYGVQIEHLCKEFDLFKVQAEWFVRGANAILLQKEIQDIRQTNRHKSIPNKDQQRELADFSGSSSKKTKPSENYVSQLEMMSFLEDIEEMVHDVDYSEFWEELGELKQKVVEQQCATENEVLRIFRISSLVERGQEEKERFFDAYPVSTDAWENGYFDNAGEITFN